MSATKIFFFLCTLCLFLLNNSLPSSASPRRIAAASRGANTPPHIVKQFLAPHNKERLRLGIPPLKWSNKLANFAASWARQRRGDCQLIHSHGNYGENLFWGSGKGWRRGDAVAAWAAERSYYDHGANSCKNSKDCLHYTQMIWNQSSRIGCAKISCRSGDTFITCNYDPPGNVVGEKPF
ncbi:Pathogenesis-related protein 1B [Linum perenne]